MKSSFKNYLHSYIRAKKGNMVQLSTIHSLAEKKGHKQSTAERLLRQENGDGSRLEVMTMYNTKGHVIGYCWAGDLTVYKS